ncbi:MAG: DUF5320 domain-containing protein [Planctomycetes bacterium]|nr:DUF5320 domain-containing protein [Planctomycetota bacterium]
MPGYDGTGPMGMGPRTGGGFGFCPPGVGVAPAAGYVRGLGRGGLPWGGGRGFGGGRGWGRGMGRGMGRGWWGRSFGYAAAPYAAPPVAAGVPAETELQWLRDQAEGMRQGLEEIGRRIAELEKAETEE